MKKLLGLLVVCLLTFSLIGCYGGGEKNTALPSNASSTIKNEEAKLNSVADIKDKRIGVLLGSVHDGYTAKNFPNATIFQ